MLKYIISPLIGDAMSSLAPICSISIYFTFQILCWNKCFLLRRELVLELPSITRSPRKITIAYYLKNSRDLKYDSFEHYLRFWTLVRPPQEDHSDHSFQIFSKQIALKFPSFFFLEFSSVVISLLLLMNVKTQWSLRFSAVVTFKFPSNRIL